MGPEMVDPTPRDSSSNIYAIRKRGWRKKSAPYGSYATPKPPLTPRPQKPEKFANAGSLHYDKDSNKIYWNENAYVLHDESTTLLGDINDIKKIVKNFTVIITKKLLNGEL